MEKTVKGAWLIHHTNKLQGVSRQSDFDTIFEAGKCGILLSAISASNEQLIDPNRIKILGKASGINTLELPSLLDRLQSEGLIKQDGKNIHVLGVTNRSVLEHTSTVFDNLDPAPEEQAAIELAEKASIAPCERKLILEELSDDFLLPSQQMRDVLELSEQIGFTDYQDCVKNSYIAIKWDGGC